jgi:HlyD family secretion protein
MMRGLLTGPRILLALLVAAVAIAVVIALRDPAVGVEVGRANRGQLVVTIDDLGETRVTDLYVVSAPITGQLLRVPLKPGAQVVPNSTVLARIQPVEPSPLDARAYAQAQAEIRSLEAELAAARARVSEARAEQFLAEREFGRTSELAGRGFISRASVDRAQMARDRSRAAVAQASQTVQATAQSLQAAQASLLVAGSKAKGVGAVSVTSPVAGFVLRVPQESARVVVAGTALVEVGDPDKLEIVTDLLSADAVRVRPGADVLVEDWGGDRPLKGRVRMIEPYGFTKISALGVEEQRVNVIIDFVKPSGAWRRMGHGYRVTVRIVTSAASNVLKVPISALFRTGRNWSVFVVDPRARARLRRVEAGKMNDDEAEIVRGLAADDRVILHPSDKVFDGVRVSERTPAG